MTYLRDTTTNFIRELKKKLIEYLPFLSQIKGPLRLKKELTMIMAPIIRKYFSDSLHAANMIMTRNIATLTNALKVPLKYTKDLIERIHGTSIFKGYYNERYGKIFARSEIDKLKRVILRGAYSDMAEAELQNEVMKTLNVTKRRAQLVARNEVQRLKEEANLIYSEQPEVREKYRRRWENTGGNIRPSHKRMHNQTEDDKGWFHSPDVGKIRGPGMSGEKWFDINCKCKTRFVLREET